MCELQGLIIRWIIIIISPVRHIPPVLSIWNNWVCSAHHMQTVTMVKFRAKTELTRTLHNSHYWSTPFAGLSGNNGSLNAEYFHIQLFYLSFRTRLCWWEQWKRKALSDLTKNSAKQRLAQNSIHSVLSFVLSTRTTPIPPATSAVVPKASVGGEKIEFSLAFVCWLHTSKVSDMLEQQTYTLVVAMVHAQLDDMHARLPVSVHRTQYTGFEHCAHDILAALNLRAHNWW